MKYYSTNKKVNGVSLDEAVIKGLAEDKGLFMPDHIIEIPAMFYENIDQLKPEEMAYTVAYMMFGEDIQAN